MTSPSTVAAINRLPEHEKREIYARVIPPDLLDLFHLNPYLVDKDGNDLLHLDCPPGSSDAEMSLYHQHGFTDPILYGHITDTLNGQIHVLLYVLNSPEGPRFDVDRMPDGTPTKFGTHCRNLEAEEAAMEAGLAPGQVRQGMRLLSKAMVRFEEFIKSLGHDLYFVEPLFYHNAVIFERLGFNYQKGRRRMGLIQEGFSPGGELVPLLDNSTPFRKLEAANSVRLRSWALHDGILGEPFTDVTMYKTIGAHAGVTTCLGCDW
jgi:hypothetical protein